MTTQTKPARDKTRVYLEYWGKQMRAGVRWWSITVEWWGENHHTGPQWCGQCFCVTSEEIARRWPDAIETWEA